MKEAPPDKIIAMAGDHIASHIESDPVYRQCLETSAVLITGSWTLGLGDEHSDLDLFLLMADEDHELLAPELSLSARSTLSHSPMLMAAKIRSIREFLDACEPTIAWFILGNAFFVDGRRSVFDQIHAQASKVFFAGLPDLRLRKLALLRRRFDWLRYSVDRDLGVSYQLLKAEFIQYYCQLMFLYDDEPYPYTKWLRSLMRLLPSRASFPPALDEDIASFLLQADARDSLKRANHLVEELFDHLRRSGKCPRPDLLDIKSEAYYGLLP